MVALFLLLLAAAPAVSTSGESVLIATDRAVVHLNFTGTVLSWGKARLKYNLRWSPVAVNLQNRTACFVYVPPKRAPDGSFPSGVMRCAPLDNLQKTWDLPQPRHIQINSPDAFAFDWVTENWYITVLGRHYVCSYLFDRCLKLGKASGGWKPPVHSFAAYDIPNRLLFYIENHLTYYYLRSTRLDGSGERQLPTALFFPFGLGVDPVRREVYFLDNAKGDKGLFRVDYNGENKRRVGSAEYASCWECTASRWRISAWEGRAVVKRSAWTVSIVSADSGETTDLVTGKSLLGLTNSRGRRVRKLAKSSVLTSVTFVPPEPLPEEEHPCAGTNYSDFCVPVVVNGSAEATHFCPPGEQLEGFTCQKTYPAFLLVTGSGSLQVVDLQTETATELLPHDVTHLDFFWEGGDEYTLFWVAGGGLYSTRWSPSTTDLIVKQMVNASETTKVLNLAVDWIKQRVIWLEDDPNRPSSSRSVRLRVSTLDGENVGTIRSDPRSRHTLLVNIVPNFNIGNLYAAKTENWTVYYVIGAIGSLKPFIPNDALPEDIVVDRFAGSEFAYGLARFKERCLWLNLTGQSVDYAIGDRRQWLEWRYRLVTHPSLAEAGGLGVLRSRLFWTDRRTGQLWMVDTETGEEPHTLAVTAGTGLLRVLHPWQQPHTSD